MRVRGELDIATAQMLEEACARETDELAFDLSGIRFLDLRGLEVLLSLRSGRHRLRLRMPSRAVRRA